MNVAVIPPNPEASAMSCDETTDPVWPIEVAPDLDRKAFIELDRVRFRPLVLAAARISIGCVAIAGLNCLIFGRSADNDSYFVLSLAFVAGTVVMMLMGYAAIDSNHRTYMVTYRSVNSWLFTKRRVEVDLGGKEQRRSFDWHVARTGVKNGVAIVRTCDRGLYSEFAIQRSSFPCQRSWGSFLEHVVTTRK